MQQWFRYRAWLLMGLALLISLIGCGGGGGGGGGGAAGATVKGRVLLVETNSPPDPAATVTIAGQSAQTDLQTGNFTLSGVPSNATTAVISAPGGSQTRTLTIRLTANQTNDLGDIYLSNKGYTATVTGHVVTQDTNQSVGNATVTIEAEQTKTDTNGRFSLTGLPVDLVSDANNPVGKVTASGFADVLLRFTLTTGTNDLGDIALPLLVSPTTPLPPYTITGKVTVQNTPAANITVTIASGGTTLGTTTTDSGGNYFFWVVPGTYTITAARSGSQNQQVNVTLTRLDTPVTAPTINF